MVLNYSVLDDPVARKLADEQDPIELMDGGGTPFADWVRVCGHSGFDRTDTPAMEVIAFTQASLILHDGPGWPWAANTFAAYSDFVQFPFLPPDGSPVRKVWTSYSNWAAFGSSLTGLAGVTNTHQRREWAENEVERFHVRRDLLRELAYKNRQIANPLAQASGRIVVEVLKALHFRGVI